MDSEHDSSFKLDLCLTADNQLVAAHDWGYYNYLTGTTHPIRYKTFLK